jgi:hypothetical protein
MGGVLMSERFCPQCQAEVEDAGGFCLLGHRFSAAAPAASLRDLRDEVDRAFEEARVQVAHALDPAGTPPPPPAVVSSVSLVIEQGGASGNDPIVEFAPAPRMDWGPERQGLLKRLG